LAAKYPDMIEGYNVDVFFPDPWVFHLRKLKLEKKGRFVNHRDYIVIYLNDNEYIGGADNFLEWAVQKFNYIDKTNQLLFKKLASN